MSIRKRENGSYVVTVCHGGRTYRKVSRHWTYADAREVESRWLAEIRRAAGGRERPHTIAEGLERWLTEHAVNLACLDKIKSDARTLVPLIRGRELADLADVWEEVKAIRGERSAAWANHRGRILRQIGRKAWKTWHWLDRPPDIKLLREHARERFLTFAEVEALASACHDDRAAGYVLLAAYTGIRRGQLLRLTHHDVRDDMLMLDRTGKTGILQAVPLHPRIANIAAQLPLGIPDITLKRAWTRAREETGIDCRWHDLRHTCASWLVQCDVPLYTVAQMLGHASPATTRRYAHLVTADLRRAVAKIP